MRIRNYLFAALFVLSCPGFVSGAGSQLGFGPATFNRDTLNIGDTLFITSYVHNFDTAAYNDFISFGLKINGIQNVNQVLFPNPYYDQVVTINPGDSIIAQMHIVITSAYFDIGPDILVVWPIAQDGSPPVFSIDSQIIVQNTGVGFKDLNIAPRLKAFYADKFIYLKPGNTENDLRRVRIYDITGQELLTEITDGSQPIPFNSEASGIYLLVADFADGETCTYKVIK